MKREDLPLCGVFSTINEGTEQSENDARQPVGKLPARGTMHGDCIHLSPNESSFADALIHAETRMVFLGLDKCSGIGVECGSQVGHPELGHVEALEATIPTNVELSGLRPLSPARF